MPTTLAIRRRRALARKGIGIPGDNEVILGVARKLRVAVEAPVLGGIAVYLHGSQRATTDLDFYTLDRRATDEQLRAGGAVWDAKHREHILDDVRIHTVTPEDAGHVVAKCPAPLRRREDQGRRLPGHQPQHAEQEGQGPAHRRVGMI